MSLYHPTPSEISATIQTGIAKHPQLTTRYQRAAKLLGNRSLYINNGWRCDSQSRPDQVYTLDSSGCDCYDFLNGGGRTDARRSGARIFCKHTLAFYAYREILIDHLNRRLAGNTRFSHERRLAAQWPEALLLLDTDSRPQLVAFQDGHRYPRPICNVRLDTRNRQTPVTNQDLAQFSRWLAKARPMPQTETMALIDNEVLAGARAQIIAQATTLEQIEALDLVDQPLFPINTSGPSGPGLSW